MFLYRFKTRVSISFPPHHQFSQSEHRSLIARGLTAYWKCSDPLFKPIPTYLLQDPGIRALLSTRSLLSNWALIIGFTFRSCCTAPASALIPFSSQSFQSVVYYRHPTPFPVIPLLRNCVQLHSQLLFPSLFNKTRGSISFSSQMDQRPAHTSAPGGDCQCTAGRAVGQQRPLETAGWALRGRKILCHDSICPPPRSVCWFTLGVCIQAFEGTDERASHQVNVIWSRSDEITFA